MGGASSAKFRIGSLVNRNRKEKLSHHVAMVAHFLDDNKTKTSLKKLLIRTVSYFIDLIQFHLICQMLAKFSGVASES